MTRRAKMRSRLLAVVLRWNGKWKRYERLGLLVEQKALKKAREQCDTDQEVRAARRIVAAVRRDEVEKVFIGTFANRIREMYPICPQKKELAIARYACAKNSRRVGRSQMAKDLDEEAIDLAVRAHIRHRHTRYDELLTYLSRDEAREEVVADVDRLVDKWRSSAGPVDGGAPPVAGGGPTEKEDGE